MAKVAWIDTVDEEDADDAQALRKVDFDERAILDIAQVTAYFAFVNRLADGRGIRLEEYWEYK
jgi:alkylhydroperoxidase family enzyme